MSRPTEPGWYWANWALGSTGRTEWRPVRVARLNSGDLVVPDGAWLIDQHEWGPRIHPPGEPPAPSLEDDCRLLLALYDERWPRDSAPFQDAIEGIRARLGAGGGTP
jgi:hypothetical protein